MELKDKIGAGKHRDCYSIEGEAGQCAKLQRETIVAVIPVLQIRIQMKMKLFLLLRFGEVDMNRREHRIISRLPDGIREYVPNIVSLEYGASPGESLLVMERPRDFDGTFSVSVADYGTIDNEHFWRCVDEIAHAMVQSDMISIDIFNEGQNILVQRVSEEEYRPVLVDVKCINRAVPHLRRPQLVFKSHLIKTFVRKLAQFKKKFQVRSKSQEQELAA